MDEKSIMNMLAIETLTPEAEKQITLLAHFTVVAALRAEPIDPKAALSIASGILNNMLVTLECKKPEADNMAAIAATLIDHITENREANDAGGIPGYARRHIVDSLIRIDLQFNRLGALLCGLNDECSICLRLFKGYAVCETAADGPSGELDNEAVNSEAVNGEANSEAVNGEAVNGEANGEAVNGEAVNGEAVNGEAVNGEAVNGKATEGEANSEAVNGEQKIIYRCWLCKCLIHEDCAIMWYKIKKSCPMCRFEL